MIIGKNIELRAVEPADLEILYSIENNQKNWIISGTHTPFSKNTLKKYIENIHDIYKDEQLRLVIQKDGLPIGLLDLFNFNPTHKRVGIGILIEPDYRKQGLALEALEIGLNYCKENLNLNQVYCDILEDNVESIKLFEGLGFENCGRKKEWILQHGVWKDELSYQKILD